MRYSFSTGDRKEMKPARRHYSNRSESDFPESKTPAANETGKKVIEKLDTDHIRLLAHNAVMWANDSGTVIGRRNDPFASSVAQENYSDEVDMGFQFSTSPHAGSGSLMLFVWEKKKLVLALTDSPGMTYNYPSDKIKVTTYVAGPWEKFLLDKGFKK
jgi:hypothetical protein